VYVIRENGNIKEVGKGYRDSSPTDDKNYYEAYCGIVLKNLCLEHKGFW
jgi:hypothetical protein